MVTQITHKQEQFPQTDPVLNRDERTVKFFSPILVLMPKN